MKKFWLMLSSLLLSVAVQAADLYSNGSEYTTLSNEQPVAAGEGKIEVLEFFWYACPHCYHLEPEVKAWLKTKPDDVTFTRAPAILGPSWELLARAYFTADILGVLDKTHKPLFEYIHKERKKIRKVDDVKAFFVNHGVSKEDFDKTFNSFAVVTKTNRARQTRDRYQLNGVPAIVVNGKYMTSPSVAGGNEEVFKVVDFLVEKERKAVDVPQEKAALAR
ncbi:MAG: thiol:disulfide interchange protein DsbA/DsbL [Gammaproteobacteria bacterium]